MRSDRRVGTTDPPAVTDAERRSVRAYESIDSPSMMARIADGVPETMNR